MSGRTSSKAGYTFPLMLVILVAIAFGAGQLERSQSYRQKRNNEEELLFRGLAYLKALKEFETASTTEKRFPRKLDELISDPRTQGRRFIRQLYKDPMTGRDFDPIRTPEGTISGVVSWSKGVPFRTVDFDKELQDFDQALTYRDWRFDAKPRAAAKPPGNTGGQQGANPGSSRPRKPAAGSRSRGPAAGKSAASRFQPLISGRAAAFDPHSAEADCSAIPAYADAEARERRAMRGRCAPAKHARLPRIR